MPELPEVEACRRLAARHCTGKRIDMAQVADDDSEVLVDERLGFCETCATVQATSHMYMQKCLTASSLPSFRRLCKGGL